MSIHLDQYDKKVLYELDKNARINTSEIAKIIKKSKQFVDYRIRRLEDEKIINKYVAVIDHSKLGYTGIRVYFKFHNLTLEKQKQIEDDLVKDKEVWWLMTAQGFIDLGFATGFKNILDFYDYFDRIMLKYKKYIKMRKVVIYSHIRQWPKSYLVGEKNTDKGTLVGASKEIVECSKFDLQLLKLISDNARMSLLEIARKLKTSPQVVKNHMKILEKKEIILRYRVAFDHNAIGYRYYKSYIQLNNTDRIKELEQYCLQHPNILNINKTIGGGDFEIEVQVCSFEEFEKLMDDVRTEFEGMFDDYDFMVAKVEKKMTYFPFE